MSVKIKNHKIRSVIVLAVLCMSVMVFADQVDASLVGYWTLNEGTGTTAHDSTVNDHDGTVSGTANWVDGKFGNAFSFSGSNDILGTLPSYTIRSIGFWFKPNSDITSGSSDQLALALRVGNTGDYFYIGFGNGTTSISGEVLTIMHDSNGRSCVMGASVPTISGNTWHRVDFIWVSEQSQYYVYLDDPTYSKPTSVPLNNIHAPLLTDTNRIEIGCNGFKGLIDDVAIWSDRLGSSDFQQIMNFSAGAYNFLKTDSLFEYDTTEMASLYNVYESHLGTTNIGGKDWTYFESDPAWVLAIDPNPQAGEYFVDSETGNYYIKLGSGVGSPLGGGVPELPAGAAALLSLLAGIGIGSRTIGRVRQRSV